MDDYFDFLFDESGGELKLNWFEFYHKNLHQYYLSVPKFWTSELTRSLEAIYPDGIPKERKVPNINFGFIDSCKVNCSATIDDNEYYIGMSASIPVCVIELVCYFINTDSFMSNIGDVTQNSKVKLDGIEGVPFFQLVTNQYSFRFSKNIPEFEKYILEEKLCAVRGGVLKFDPNSGRELKASEYFQQIRGLYSYLLPDCPERMSCVEYFSELIITFFWMHEISHVLEGHLLLIRDKNESRVASIYEYSDKGYSNDNAPECGIDINLKHCLETIADEIALDFILGLFEDGKDTPPHINGSISLPQSTRLVLFLILITAVFCAIDKQSKLSQEDYTSEHPKSSVRLTCLLARIYALSEVNEKYADVFTLYKQILHKLSETKRFGFMSVGSLLGENEQDALSTLSEIRYEYLETLIEYADIYPNMDTVTPSYNELMKDAGVFRELHVYGRAKAPMK